MVVRGATHADAALTRMHQSKVIITVLGRLVLVVVILLVFTTRDTKKVPSMLAADTSGNNTKFTPLRQKRYRIQPWVDQATKWSRERSLRSRLHTRQLERTASESKFYKWGGCGGWHKIFVSGKCRVPHNNLAVGEQAAHHRHQHRPPQALKIWYVVSSMLEDAGEATDCVVVVTKSEERDGWDH